jgi:hypothetical protein
MIAERRIDSPADLSQIMCDIKLKISEGKLRQIWKSGSILSTDDPIEGIPEDGPWDDFLEMYFVDVESGEEYRLLVETYHGSGGSWEKLR